LRYTEPNDANGILTTILKYAISDAAENCKSAKELETLKSLKQLINAFYDAVSCKI